MNIFDNNKAKKMRIEKGLTQEALSEILGIPSNLLAKYERGICEPNKCTVDELARFYGCPFQDLIKIDLTLVNNYPIDRQELSRLNALLQRIGDPSLLTPTQAKTVMQDINEFINLMLLNQINYCPVNFSDVSYTIDEKDFQKDADDALKRLKTIIKVLSVKNPYKGMPLKHNVVLPVLKPAFKIPLIDSFNDVLRKIDENRQLLLPDFSDCDTIAVFSDYGGDSGQESYMTYSFLFADFNSISTVFNCLMQSIRRKYFTEWPEKEIAFKHIKQKHIKESLWEYLCAADNSIHGLLFTLIVDRRINGLFGDIQENAKIINARSGLDWKPKVLEKLIRVDTVIAYFLNLLGYSTQKVFWLTDDDSIIENEEKGAMAAQSIINMTHIFENPVIFQTTGYGKCSTFRQEYTGAFIDALSLTDIVGGSVNHYLTREKQGGKDFEIKEQVDIVCKWLTQQGASLNRINIIVRPDNKKKGSYYLGALNFELKQGEKMPGEVKYIDIDYPTILF